MENKKNFCSDCNFQGASPYYYKRHIETKLHFNTIQYKTSCAKIYNKFSIVNLNIQNAKYIKEQRCNEVLTDCINWLKFSLRDKNIKTIKLMISLNDICVPIQNNFIIPFKSKSENIMCPWCFEYNSINNLVKNINIETPKMTVNSCSEHMKTCSNKINHKNITKNFMLTLNQSLQTILDMTENFKILSNNYERIQKQNDEYRIMEEKFNKLKTKHANLKKIQSENIHHTTINNNGTINFMTYITNHCKDAIAIDAVDNNRRIIENKFVMDYIMPKMEITKKEICKNNMEIVEENLNNEENEDNEEIDNDVTIEEVKEITKDSNDSEIGSFSMVPSSSESPLAIFASLNSPSFGKEYCDKLARILAVVKNIDTSKNFVLQKMFIRAYSNNKNNYHMFIGDCLIKFYKKLETSERPIWSTDSSRFSYIIKTIQDDWIKDKNGIVLIEKCVKPFLEHIRELLEEYEEYLDNEINELREQFMNEAKQRYISKYKNKRMDRYDFTLFEDCISSNDELLDFSSARILEDKLRPIYSLKNNLVELFHCIDKEIFYKKVIKEITPHFTFDKIKLTKINSINS